MKTHRYIVPQKHGLQHFSGDPVPEMDPAEFVADEQTAMERLVREARSKGLVLGAAWETTDDGWERLVVWECQEDVEAAGTPYPPIGEIRRVGV